MGWRDAQPNDQLGDRSRVRVRRIENSNASLRRRFEIDLVNADAERTDRKKFVRRVNDVLCDLSFGSNAEKMNAFDGLHQVLFAHRAVDLLDGRVAVVLQLADGGVGNILEQEDLDLVFWIGCLDHERDEYSKNVSESGQVAIQSIGREDEKKAIDSRLSSAL